MMMEKFLESYYDDERIKLEKTFIICTYLEVRLADSSNKVEWK